MSVRGSRNAASVGIARMSVAVLRLPGMGDEPRYEELVALIALLAECGTSGKERPMTIDWSLIGSQVARRGSAVSLWDEWHPPTLDGWGGQRVGAGACTVGAVAGG